MVGAQAIEQRSREPLDARVHDERTEGVPDDIQRMARDDRRCAGESEDKAPGSTEARIRRR